MRCSTSLFVWHCVADALLTFSSGLVILIGSYSFLKCLRKRAKSAAKLGGKAREWRSKSKRNKLVKVHPSPSVESEHKHAQVHPAPVASATAASTAAAAGPKMAGLVQIWGTQPTTADGAVREDVQAEISAALSTTLGADNVTITSTSASKMARQLSSGRWVTDKYNITVEYEATFADAAAVETAVAHTDSSDAGTELATALKSQDGFFAAAQYTRATVMGLHRMGIYAV